METRSALLNQPENAIGDILEDLERGKVIPVLGADLFQAQYEGREVPLETGLARACAQKLGLADAGTYDSINQVFVQYLGQGGIPEEIYEALERVSNQFLGEPLDWLVDLASIRSFKLFVTTAFVDVVERAIEKARGVRPDVKIYAKSQFEDLDPPYDKLDHPVVYHLFGKISSYPNYVASEQDALEFLSFLQDKNYQPSRLFDALRSNNLLLLGCRFPDWVTRFFLRGLMGKSLLEERRSKKYIIESSLEAGQPLVLFLSRFSFRTSMISMEPTEFVRLLTQEWRKRQTAAGATAQAPERINVENIKGSVFVSYASEDGAAAQGIADALERNRIPVWYDKRRLKAGDSWDPRIREAVLECAYFMPLISRTTDSVVEGYFREEWKLAAERSRRIDDTTPFILPVVIDETDLERARVPRDFPAKQGARVPGGKADEAFIKRMIDLMREYHIRAEGGRR